MEKSPDAFRTISEVSDVLETPAHVLRFWESRFPQIRPVKRAGGRRYYRPSDIALLTGIKRLLHDEGMTIRGVQKILREHGVRHVTGLMEETIPEPAEIVVLYDSFIGKDDLADVPDVAQATSLAQSPVDRPVQAEFPFAIMPTYDIRQTDEDAAEPVTAPATRGLVRAIDSSNFAMRIRGLPPLSMVLSKVPITDIARRLSGLRDRMAARAACGTD